MIEPLFVQPVLAPGELILLLFLSSRVNFFCVGSKQSEKMCNHCKGSGVCPIQPSSQQGILLEVPCFRCQGSGRVILHKHKCPPCGGEGVKLLCSNFQ